MGAGGREKKEWEPGPREERGKKGPREERGKKGTSTKRRGDKDDGEQDSVTVIPVMYMQHTATSEHSEQNNVNELEKERCGGEINCEPV